MPYRLSDGLYKFYKPVDTVNDEHYTEPYTEPYTKHDDEDKYLSSLRLKYIELFGAQFKKQFVIRNLELCDDITKHSLLNVNSVPAFYKKVLSGTFLAAIESNLAAPVAEQLSLLQELSIIREIANPAIEELSTLSNQVNALKELLHNDPDGSNSDVAKDILPEFEKLRELAAIKAVSVLKTVSEFCDKAAKIDALSRDKFSIHTINSIVAQITRLISDELHGKGLDHIAVDIEEAIRNKLVIPVSNEGSCGTDITPDMIKDTVEQMDRMMTGELNDE